MKTIFKKTIAICLIMLLNLPISAAISTQATEFYYIRHGQTNDNVRGYRFPYSNAPLNMHGIEQAIAVIPIIDSLQIKSVCFSPLKRAKQTKEIIINGARALRLDLKSLQLETCNTRYKRTIAEFEIPELAECSQAIYKKMVSLGRDLKIKAQGQVKDFLNTVSIGINKALSKPEPVLIVAHGGVYRALCSLLNTEGQWSIKNCELVKFYKDKRGQWKTTALN